MNFYRIKYKIGEQDIGAFTQGNVDSNSTDRTKPFWRLDNILFYIHTDDRQVDTVYICDNSDSKVIDNISNPIESIEDITIDEFRSAFEEIKKRSFDIRHHLPKDYDIAGISTPEKIIYIPSRGREYNIEEHYVEMYFGPNTGSFPVPIRQAVSRKEQVIEPKKKIGNFEFVPEESTLCTSVYKLMWRNWSLEEFLEKIEFNTANRTTEKKEAL